MLKPRAAAEMHDIGSLSVPLDFGYRARVDEGCTQHTQERIGGETLAYAFTMTIMSIEAWSHGMQRKDSPQDIVIIGAIGVLLLAVRPARERASAVSTDLVCDVL